MKSKMLLSSLIAFIGAGVTGTLLFMGQQAASADTLAILDEAPEYLSFHTEDEQNNIEIFQKASPSVVYVTNTAVRQTSPFSRNLTEIPQGTGTGFVWDKSGLVVTNYHVVEGASRVIITLQDHSSWEGEYVGHSVDKDLALFRISAPEEMLTPLPLGNSEQLQVGRKVIAIGNPFGLDTTLTVGVVSALGREIQSMNNRTIRDVIQTDASINPGNSGGPLLNSLGQLVGVNTQIISPSGASAGIGFAIPVNTIRKIIPQLVEFGREVRPVIGIEYVPDQWADSQGIDGVVVLGVTSGTPADDAGILGVRQNTRGDIFLGDVIIEINDIPVEDSDDLFNELEKYQPGETVIITTERESATMNFEVKLGAPI